MSKMVFGWELTGICVIVLAGSALHFLFKWTNYLRPVALIAAVNESTWEHLKMAFWPGLVFALVEYPFIRKSVDNFWVAKTLCLLVMPAVIVLLFYGYTAILGRHYLVMDILIFVLGVVAGQLAGYRVLMTDRMPAGAQRYALAGLAALIAAFSLLTYYPPRFFLFEDPRTNQYGILDRPSGQE